MFEKVLDTTLFLLCKLINKYSATFNLESIEENDQRNGQGRGTE